MRSLDSIYYEEADDDINFWLDSFNKISLKEFINKIIKKKDVQLMNKQELQNEINKTKEHLAKMEKMLEQCEYERWKPKYDEAYWYVNDGCYVCQSNYYNDGLDTNKIDTYNCFQTREQAEAEAEKILVRRQLEDIARRLNKGEKIDWNNTSQCKCSLRYNIVKKAIDINLDYNFVHIGVSYCLDSRFKDVAIQEIGEERLKKYLRGE